MPIEIFFFLFLSAMVMMIELDAKQSYRPFFALF